MRVLIAEDDPLIRGGLAEVLEGEGYAVITAPDGQVALKRFQEARPELVLLDIMMPGLDGYSVCREIRRTSPDTPIIFISAKSEEVDRVLGLELGADDFILKPFGVREVIARIRAVTRRCYKAASVEAPQSFTLGDLEISPAELRARRGEAVVELSLREVKMLSLLYRKRGQAVDRDTFFNECWGLTHQPNSRTLDQHIARLRKRLEQDPANPVLIRTVHGVGYRYD